MSARLAMAVTLVMGLAALWCGDTASPGQIGTLAEVSYERQDGALREKRQAGSYFSVST